MDTPVQPAEAKEPKKIVERSAAYPFITIEKAVEIVTTLYKSYPATPCITREDAAAVIKSGYLNREIAAAVHYAILKREEKGYSITPLFKSFYKSLDEKEKQQAFIAAFEAPKLYQELIKAYDGHAIPAEFETILFRKYEITEKASGEAAGVFIENAKAANVLDENNILRVEASKQKLSNTQFAEVTTVINERPQHNEEIYSTTALNESPAQYQLPPAEIPSAPDEELLKIRVTDKKVVKILYPLALNLKDIAIIKKQLDVLSFTIQQESTDEILE